MAGSSKPNGHQWFLTQLIPYRCGLLEAEEERRFEEHLSKCAPCKETWARYQTEHESEARAQEHIPSAIIVRWDIAQDRLSGFERDLMHEHLQWCDDCRQDLVAVGFEPHLEKIISHDEGAASQPVNLVFRGRVGVGWRERLFGGWAVAATAAAVLVWVWMGSMPDADKTSTGTILPWVSPGQLRGARDQNAITVASGTRSLIVPVKLPDSIRPGETPVIEIYSPENTLLASAKVEQHDVATLGRVMFFIQSGKPLVSGSYRVLIWRDDREDTAEAVDESYFELRVVEPSESP